MKPHRLTGAIGMFLLWAPIAFAVPPPDSPAARREAEKLAQLPPVKPHARIDHSGRKQAGHASYYAERFSNRKMADGHRFNPNSDSAASKSLPLGTTAKVTNVENGKSTMVKVEDRGRLVNDRVIDLAPKAADRLDIKKQGVAPVIVAPVAVPLPNGEVKLGAGAAGASQQELQKATEETAQTAAH